MSNILKFAVNTYDENKSYVKKIICKSFMSGLISSLLKHGIYSKLLQRPRDIASFTYDEFTDKIFVSLIDGIDAPEYLLDYIEDIMSENEILDDINDVLKYLNIDEFISVNKNKQLSIDTGESIDDPITLIFDIAIKQSNDIKRLNDNVIIQEIINKVLKIIVEDTSDKSNDTIYEIRSDITSYFNRFNKEVYVRDTEISLMKNLIDMYNGYNIKGDGEKDTVYSSMDIPIKMQIPNNMIDSNYSLEILLIVILLTITEDQYLDTIIDRYGNSSDSVIVPYLLSINKKGSITQELKIAISKNKLNCVVGTIFTNAFMTYDNLNISKEMK